MAKSRLHELAARGQAVWFDTLSRDLVHSGELKKMMDEDAVTGVTSNPTIFQKALSSGDAYDEDLKKLLASGGDPSKVASVASFFGSRVDSEADKRLDEVGHPELKGKLAIANAKLAYEHYVEVFGSDRWAYLEGKGATRQRCLWASTSTKNPEYRDVMYVEELIGPETVNTMPLEKIQAFQDHGKVSGDTVLDGVKKARKLLEKLDEAA